MWTISCLYFCGQVIFLARTWQKFLSVYCTWLICLSKPWPFLKRCIFFNRTFGWIFFAKFMYKSKLNNRLSPKRYGHHHSMPEKANIVLSFIYQHAYVHVRFGSNRTKMFFKCMSTVNRWNLLVNSIVQTHLFNILTLLVIISKAITQTALKSER